MSRSPEGLPRWISNFEGLCVDKGNVLTIKIMAVLMLSPIVRGAVTIPSYTPPGYEDSASSSAAGTPIEIEGELKPEVGVTAPPCNKGEYEGKDLSWNFLNAISSGRIFYDDDISLNAKGELKGNLYLDYYISACFVPAIKTVKRGEGIFVRVENVYFDGKEEYDGIRNIDKKYEQCLKNEGLLTGEGSLDMEKIEDKGLISSVALPYRDAEKNGAPLKLDKNRTYQIYFASNKASDYGTPMAESVAGRPSGENWKCSGFHQLSRGKPFYKGELDLLSRDVIDICEGKDFDKKIKGVLRLRNSSLVGNFEELSGVVDDILIDALEKEQEGIFEGEGGLEDIESKMRELLVESRKRDKRMDNEELGDEAKKLGKNYKKLMDRLEDKIYRPAKKMIEKLHEDYKNARSDQERERINDKLEGLSEIMGRLSDKRKGASCNRGPCAFYRQFYVYEGQEQFRRDASNFENLRLSSAFWSRTSKGVRGSLGPTSAGRKVKVGMRKFARKTDAWGRDASILEGDASPIRAKQRRIGRSFEKAQKLYQEGPYKNLSWWCKSVNTEACAKKRRRREQIFQRKMQRLGRSIQKNQSQLGRYEELFGQYQLRMEYEREQYGWGGEDESWEDGDYYLDQYHFPGFGADPYASPYPPGPYEPSQYNFGGNDSLYPPMDSRGLGRGAY